MIWVNILSKAERKELGQKSCKSQQQVGRWRRRGSRYRVVLSEWESRQTPSLQQRFARRFVGTKVFPERMKIPNIRSSRLGILANVFWRCRRRKFTPFEWELMILGRAIVKKHKLIQAGRGKAVRCLQVQCLIQNKLTLSSSLTCLQMHPFPERWYSCQVTDKASRINWINS